MRTAVFLLMVIVLTFSRKDELRYRAEILNRFSIVASCWYLAFSRELLSMLQARRQLITSFILCFLPILIMYYPAMFLMIDLCTTGILGLDG